jgi:hypothetical protein
MNRRLEARAAVKKWDAGGGYTFQGPGFHVWDSNEAHAASWAAALAEVARAPTQRSIGDDELDPIRTGSPIARARGR